MKDLFSLNLTKPTFLLFALELLVNFPVPSVNRGKVCFMVALPEKRENIILQLSENICRLYAYYRNATIMGKFKAMPHYLISQCDTKKNLASFRRGNRAGTKLNKY